MPRHRFAAIRSTACCAMRPRAGLALALCASLAFVAGCTAGGPDGGRTVRDAAGGTAYGLASCRASARRGCPELVGRTLYTGSGTALYFAPDGYLYSWADRTLSRRFWGLSPDGGSVSFTGGGLPSFAFPVGELQTYQAFEGDAAQLSRRYGSGVRTMPFALTARSGENFRGVLDRLYS